MVFVTKYRQNVFNKTILHDLKTIFSDVCIESNRAVLPPEEGLENWTAVKIRDWMQGHQESLHQVTELDLSSKNLEVIPSEIGLFKGLTNLDLSHNQIIEISEGIFDNLNNIERVLLTHNQITSVSKDLFELMLQKDSIELFNVRFNPINTDGMSEDEIQELHMLALRLLDL